MLGMPDIQSIISWFMSGNGRLTAGAALFVLIWAIKSLPKIKDWIEVDSGRLTSGRKKALANLLLAMAPVAVALTDGGKSLHDVLLTALTATTTAAGIHSIGKTISGG